MYHLYLEDGSVNPKLYDKDIIIYGCGNDGKKLYSELKDKNKSVKFFCDSNLKLHEKTVFDIPIISYEELSKLSDCNIALAFFKWPEVINRIPEKLKSNLFADFLFENPTNKKCILCKSTDTTMDKAHFAPFLKERMFLGKEKNTSLIHCKNCDLYFSEYRPSDEEMDRLYCSYRDENYLLQRMQYEKGYTEEYNSLEYINLRISLLANFLKKYMDLNSIKKLLDYGGDKGQFIPKEFVNAKKYVYEVSGNQVIDGIKLLKNLQDVNKIKWDFIMCCQVLEHLSDPLSVLKNLVDITADNAFLYLDLPCEDRIKRYSNVEINEHINFYTDITTKKIGEIFNLDIIAIKQDNAILRALYRKRIK